ncbi:MAG: ubiquinol-cytochrome c reductase iron-sulfur subunit [Anaerolineales bacterium]|jgi:menaquinol-cytochrome c reductase iron-sulfur subunit|nr:ubiquinol-cytochrome c reductase iron-sulfur subunit [Anaerolineales bacterium]
MAESHHLDRREFVKIVTILLGTIMGIIMGIPLIGYLVSPATKVQKKESWVPLGPLDGYPVGIPTLFSFTRSTVNGWEKTVISFGAYVMRYSESQDDVTVFSSWCTHLSCRVHWEEGEQVYVCPCHDGIFDVEGKVVAGPPPEPLWEYENKIEDGNLFIFVEG